MKLNFEWRFRLRQILFGATILIALVAVCGIHAKDEPIHMSTDWSHRHMVFSPAKTWEQQTRISRNERYRQQLERRKAKDNRAKDARAIMNGFRQSTLEGASIPSFVTYRPSQKQSSPQRGS